MHWVDGKKRGVGGWCGVAVGAAGGATLAQEAEALRQAVDGALAQCLHVLYGVALLHRDPDWGGTEVPHSTSTLYRPASCFSTMQYSLCSPAWALGGVA